MEEKLIYKKIIEILRAVSPIGKDRKNTQQNYNFRGIDDVYNELHNSFAEHGVFISPNVTNTRREERPSKGGGLLIWTIVDVIFSFFAEDGSSVQVAMVGEAMDSGDKGCNKAMSAALKYALMQMLLIPTEDKKDVENDTPELKDPKQILKEECLDLISKSKEVEDLKQLKSMYKELFLKDKDVIEAGVKKHKQITSQPVPAQTA